MSLGRRSDRVRKKVDYAKFCEDEDRSENNSDDDFQDGAIPPPLKKIKSTVPVKSKAKQKHEEAKSISKQSGAVKRKERLSRDEKLYQKELEAALKASIIESQQSSADNESSSTANNDEEDISDEEDRIESKRKKARLLPSSDVEDNNNKENTDGGTQINWTRRSASDGEAGSSDDIKYKQVTKTSNLKKNNTLEEVEDEEERDEPELDQEESDLDSEEMSNAGSFSDLGDDSDFDEARAKKKVKGRGRGKPTSSPTKPGVKPRTSVTVTPLKMRGKGKSKGQVLSANSSHSSSASNSPSAAANEPAVLQPKAVEAMSDSLPKTIPGMGLGGVNIKSSGPSIRLGLSRNVRVKPLHSHVSVQH